MTPKERVKTTLRHEEPDRVPMGEFAIDYKIIEQVLGHETFYRAKAKQTMALWEGRRDEVVESEKKDIVEFTRKVGLDAVCVNMCPPKNAIFEKPKQIDENTWEDRCGNILRYSEATEDIMLMKRGDKPENKIQQPPPDGSEWELWDYIVQELGETHFIFARGAGGAGGIGYPTFLGIEQSMINIIERPDEVAASRMRAAEGVYDRVKLALERGADAMFFGEDFGHNLGPFVSPNQFRKIFFPSLKVTCDAAHAAGSPVLFHSCGNLKLILDQMVEAGIDAYQAIQMYEKIDDYKRDYGDKLTLWGGVDCNTLCRGTPDDVREEARFAIKTCAPGGGFVLGSSHSIMIATTYDNFMAMIDVAHTEGRYPIT